MSKIAVIGAGAMGGATVEGLIKGDYFRNEDITVADPSQKVIDKFAQMGLAVTTDNQLAAESADVVCVVVKPWLVEHVLKDIKPGLDPQKQLLIEATTHRDCCRCTICQHQGMAGREVPSPLPRHPQYRYC